ncbi:MAG: hypothetical protein DMG37_20080, partial [Acidobacteria bacterium]
MVGGGISGLVCAHALQKTGVEVLLAEASARPGGVIHSVRRDGYLLEHGPQSFSGTSQLRSLCTDLGIVDQLLEAPPRAPRYVLVNGELQAVPMSPPAFFTSSLLNGSTKWALLRDIFGNSTPPEGDESVAAFVRRKFSDQLLERLAGPFVSGVYAGDPEKLSIRSTFPQLHEAEKAAGSVVRGMMRLAKNKKGPRERATLNTFRGGNETLVQTLASRLGSKVLTKTAAVNIFRQTAFEALLTTVEYAAVAVVSLGYAKRDVGHSLDGFGFLVPRTSGLRILGSVWNSSLFPGRAPEGHALLTTFIGGATDPSATKLSSEELSNIVHGEIARLLAIKKTPVFCNVTIWPRALPQYNLGHSERLALIHKSLARFPGLFLTGNYLRGPAIG